MRTKLPAFAALAGASVLVLAGCSSDGGGGQTVAEACAIANDSMATVQSDIASAMSDMSSGDLSSVGAAFDTMQSQLREAENEITNAEVKTAIGDLAESVDAFGGYLTDAADGGLEALAEQADEVQAAATEVQTAGTAVNDLCAA